MIFSTFAKLQSIPLKLILFSQFSAVTGQFFLKICLWKYIVLFCCSQKRNSFLWVFQAKYIFGHLFHTQHQWSLHYLKKRLGGKCCKCACDSESTLAVPVSILVWLNKCEKIPVSMWRLLTCYKFTAWFSEDPVSTYFRLRVHWLPL